MNNGQPPSPAAKKKRLVPLKHVLAHAPVTADTRLLVVCPMAMKDLAETLQDMIRHHRVNFRNGGSVRSIFCNASIVPDLNVLRNQLPDPNYDLVIIYGYEGVLAALNDQAMTLWIASWADLVKPNHPSLSSGRLLIELSRKPEEIWTDTALRYDELLYNEGIRLLSVNSLCGAVATDRLTLRSRFKNLARNLEYASNESLSMFITYLKIYKKIIKGRMKLLNEDILAPKDPLLGLFTLDGTTRERESRWKDVDGPVKITSIDGVRMDAKDLAPAITDAWEAGETPEVGTEAYFETPPKKKRKF